MLDRLGVHIRGRRYSACNGNSIWGNGSGKLFQKRETGPPSLVSSRRNSIGLSLNPCQHNKGTTHPCMPHSPSILSSFLACLAGGPISRELSCDINKLPRHEGGSCFQPRVIISSHISVPARQLSQEKRMVLVGQLKPN